MINFDEYYVLEHIGMPDDLVKVDIKDLKHNHYRVNVYREIKNITKMTDSYYVTIVDDTPISSPEMKKKYFDAELAMSHP